MGNVIRGRVMAGHSSPLLDEAAAYLATQERDIIFRWVQMASRLPAHFRRTDEDMEAMIDHMPVVLTQWRRLLTVPIEQVEHSSEEPDGAETHGLTRYNQQIPARTVVKEYQILRREIWRTLQRWPRAEQIAVADFFLLQEQLNYMLDHMVSVALDTYVELVAEGGEGDAVEPGNYPGSG
jgi:hypothetical protein